MLLSKQVTAKWTEGNEFLILLIFSFLALKQNYQDYHCTYVKEIINKRCIKKAITILSLFHLADSLSQNKGHSNSVS